MDGYEGLSAGEVAVWLPDAADTELVELWILADDGDVERNCVGGDDSVEWVAMVSSKASGAKCGFYFDREKSVAQVIQSMQEVSFEGLGALKFA